MFKPVISRLSLTCAALTAALLGAAQPSVSLAQAYPNKTIRIVVPFAPGGTSDILARAIGPKLTEAWGQPVVVENRAGANGNVGADFVAKAPADGYTLFLTDLSVLSINQSVYTNMTYDGIKDFAPVIMVSYSPHVLGVHPSVPVNSVKELIEYAKANPGKLNFAISGTGGAPHLAGIAFAQRTGVKWAYIPYKGGSQAVADVAAGQANVIMNGMLAWKSMAISTTCSTPLRKCAARKPSAVPSVAAMIVPNSAISRLMRIDMMRRESTSRPSSSVPSRCAQVPPIRAGGASRAFRSSAVKE